MNIILIFIIVFKVTELSLGFYIFIRQLFKWHSNRALIHPLTHNIKEVNLQKKVKL